jgi:hypothetical protein
LTLTDIARIPDGMTGGRPAPTPAAATLLCVTGSCSEIVAMTPRSTSSFGSANAPGTCVRDGQAATVKWSAVSRVPTGSAVFATTTGTVLISTLRTGIDWMAR